jgi:hypothetical protein
MRRCFDESDLSAREVLRAHAFERRINRRGGAGIRRGTGRGNSVGAQQNALPPLAPDPILYGLRFPTASDYYTTADDFGEPGVLTGFGFGAIVSVETFPVSTTRYLFHRYFSTSGQISGWALFINTSQQFSLLFVNASGSYSIVSFPALLSSDLGKLFHVCGVHNGGGAAATWQPYLNGLPVGLPVAINSYKVAAAKPMMLGRSDFGSAPVGAAGTTTIGTFTVRGIPSAAAVKEHAERSRAAGYVAPNMAGVAMTHVHSPRDVLTDTGAVSGQVAPAVLPDIVTSVANDALARVGSPTVVVADSTVVDGRKAYGVQGFTAANQLQAPNGVRGVVGGFWFSFYMRPNALTATTQILANSGRTVDNNGWTASISSSLALTWSANSVSAPAYTLVTSDLGQPMLVVCALDPSGNTRRLYIRSAEVGTGAAGAAYTPHLTEVMTIGRRLIAGSELPLTSASFLGFSGGNGCPSPAQVQQLFADVERTGRIQAIAGLTTYSVDPTADVVENGGPDNGVPAVCKDRVGTDHAARIGTGLTVAQRVERVWSYDTTPILSGADSLTVGDYFESAAGFAGDNAGFWVCAFISIRRPVASGLRTLFACRGTGNPGWMLFSNGPNSSMQFQLGGIGGAGYISSPALVLSDADAGRLLLVHGVWDGPALTARLYHKRLQVAAGAVFTGGTFVPDPGVTMIGRSRQAAPSPADGLTVWGVAAGLGVPTLAEIQAHFDDVMASEELARGIPGKTNLRINIKADIAANGGAMPAQLLDRVGTAHFTRVGNPVVANQTARAWGW